MIFFLQSVISSWDNVYNLKILTWVNVVQVNVAWILGKNGILKNWHREYAVIGIGCLQTETQIQVQ